MEQEGYLHGITWGSVILSLDLWKGDSLPLVYREVGKEKAMPWGCFLFMCQGQEGISWKEKSEPILLAVQSISRQNCDPKAMWSMSFNRLRTAWVVAHRYGQRRVILFSGVKESWAGCRPAYSWRNFDESLKKREETFK